jgi:single-stranded DNA-binding protein
MNFNLTVFTGRLAADVLYTAANPGVVGSRSRALARLIVNRDQKSKDGSVDYDVIPLVFWGADADNMARYSRKGKEIMVRGSVRTKYEKDADKESSKNTWEVHVSYISYGVDSGVAQKNKDAALLEQLPADLKQKYQEVMAFLEKAQKQEQGAAALPNIPPPPPHWI